ncbi:hypothetical protein RF11_15765 [Thelohanellus kitauei]|uniref:Uncharacterized protein n=1 Tax=Thelohanellus kitauei TaxID=669202 RepID=A0A0C2MWP7_THEKT|nr:hypothetical protein RF11_15765 [Thelohanellus kitauei]
MYATEIFKTRVKLIDSIILHIHTQIDIFEILINHALHIRYLELFNFHLFFDFIPPQRIKEQRLIPLDQIFVTIHQIFLLSLIRLACSKLYFINFTTIVIQLEELLDTKFLA